MDLIQEHHFLIPKLLNNSIACCSLINLDFLLAQTKIVWWKHYSSDVWLLKELWNCNLILNCFFSKENYTLAHKTKYLHMEIKFSSYKQYLFDLLLPRNTKKTHTDQSILQTVLLFLEGNVSQTFNSSSCRNVFPKCVYHWYNLLWWMFFIPCENWKTLFFIKIYRYPEVWYNRHVAAFFEGSVLEEVRIFYRLSPQ